MGRIIKHLIVTYEKDNIIHKSKKITSEKEINVLLNLKAKYKTDNLKIKIIYK